MNRSTQESIGMALAGNYPRSSVRALIVHQGKILVIRCQKDEEIYYLLPGGGQQHQEGLEDAIKRECLEELGCKIKINELVYVYDYIGANDPSDHANPHFHAIHHVFWCELTDSENLGKNCLMDTNQTGHEWLPLGSLSDYNFFPKQLIPSLQNPKEARLYLGTLN